MTIWQRLAAFLRASGGASAVEFALVVPMLFAIIFSTFEAGWLMTQTIMLDHALDRTVRELRTGRLDAHRAPWSRPASAAVRWCWPTAKTP